MGAAAATAEEDLTMPQYRDNILVSSGIPPVLYNFYYIFWFCTLHFLQPTAAAERTQLSVGRCAALKGD